MASTMRIPTEFIAIDKFSSVVQKMTAGTKNFGNTASAAIDRFNAKANVVAGNMAMAGTAIIAPLGLAVNAAVKFEDKMADVAKTTGLSEKESEAYGKAILDMSKKTRTSISALQDIGVVAGTIGVAKDELVAFTKAGNQFAIALGSDFGSTEFAVEQVAKLKNLFKETRGIDIATSMTKAGSAINEVSNSAGSAKNINDFMLRIGALPDAMKPSIQSSAALGGFLEDAGLSAEIAAGGFSNLILVAGKNMTGFSQQMGMTVEAANKIYQTDPTKFATTFAKSLNKLKPRELAMVLDNLKIGSQETIKVVGALGSGYEKLAKVQGISNKAFADGTSINAEAAKKNQTMAGKIEMAKNNMEALSITVGTQLAPILGKLIDKVTPIIEKFGKWANDNPALITTIANVGIALLVMSGIIKGVTIVTSIFQGIMFIYSNAARIATVSQWAWNAAMYANPIGLIIVGVVALIGFIALIVAKWDEWGAAVSIFMGPLGLVISLIQSFRRNWDMVKEAFATGGIIGGIKAIGLVIMDAILMPVQQLLELLAKIPGMGDLAGGGAEKIKAMRESMETLEAPEGKQAKATANATVNGKVGIEVSAKGGAQAKTTSTSGGGIPVRVTPTQGAFGK